MKKVRAVLLLWIVSLTPVLAQKNLAVWNFEDDLCTYKGYYDTKKCNETVLKDTYFLTRAQLYFDGKDEEELTRAYQAIKNQLTSLKLFPAPVFADARDSMIRYLDESYDIQQARIKAIEDPKVLGPVFFDRPEVQKYSHALINGGKTLLKAYEQIVKKQMEANADPDNLWRKYESNMRLDHREEIAFDYVLTYGWWNQVNDLIYHYQSDGTLTEAFYDLFERVVTVDCDEV